MCEFKEWGSKNDDCSNVDTRVRVVWFNIKRKEKELFFTTTDVTNALYSDRRMIDNMQWALKSYFFFLKTAIMAAECRRAEAQSWAKEGALGCMNSPPVARWSQEAEFTQPMAISFVQPCVSYIHDFNCLSHFLVFRNEDHMFRRGRSLWLMCC